MTRPEDIRVASECDDELPLLARVGRGLKGNSLKAEILDPSDGETYIKIKEWDEASKTFISETMSQNVNGGKLTYEYCLRPFNNPQTFSITFKYVRPGHEEWAWTTPNIPYIWSTGNEEGENDRTDPDHIVGSGVATIFIKTTNNGDRWKEFLQYPDGFTREDFNAPTQGEDWTSDIVFGFGGDVELPSLADLAKALGITEDQLRGVLSDIPGSFADSDNVKDYVDDHDKALNDHIHNDMGFGQGESSSLIGDKPESVLPTGDSRNPLNGKPYTVKNYIDWKFNELELAQGDQITYLQNHVKNLYGLIDDIVGHIYGATSSTVTSGQPSTAIGNAEYKKITWNPNNVIPQGNINVLSGDDLTYSIRTSDAVEDNDIRSK